MPKYLQVRAIPGEECLRSGDRSLTMPGVAGAGPMDVLRASGQQFDRRRK
jgi:hypothetical protein